MTDHLPSTSWRVKMALAEEVDAGIDFSIEASFTNPHINLNANVEYQGDLGMIGEDETLDDYLEYLWAPLLYPGEVAPTGIYDCPSEHPGCIIYLLDNGDEEVSGDIKEGDNTFTRKVAFPYNATTGSLEWKFRVQDWQGGFTDSTITVTVQ